MKVLRAITDWYCPNCKGTDQTRGSKPNEARYHTCPRLRGLSAPMLRAGIAAKVEARDREDYVGSERVQSDANGRPIMAIVTVRDNGQDTVVLAPAASNARAEARLFTPDQDRAARKAAAAAEFRARQVAWADGNVMAARRKAATATTPADLAAARLAVQRAVAERRRL